MNLNALFDTPRGARRAAALVATIIGMACMLTRPAVADPAENIGTVTEVYDGTLTSDIQVHTFRHIDRLFPVRIVKHGPNVLALPRARRPLAKVGFTSGGKAYDLIDYMALNRVTALLVLKDGKIAFEDYEMGNTERTRWMSMSMVKSITSSLVGAAIQDGHIRNIDDSVTQYVATLKGSAYDGVSIRYLLEMASGVAWDETYTNPASDRRRMLEAQIAQRPGAILDLMAKLARPARPGRSGITAPGRHSSPAPWCAPRWAGRWRITCQSGSGPRPAWRPTQPGGWNRPAVWKSAAAVSARPCAITADSACFLMNGGVARGEKILPDGWVPRPAAAR